MFHFDVLKNQGKKYATNKNTTLCINDEFQWKRNFSLEIKTSDEWLSATRQLYEKFRSQHFCEWNAARAIYFLAYFGTRFCTYEQINRSGTRQRAMQQSPPPALTIPSYNALLHSLFVLIPLFYLLTFFLPCAREIFFAPLSFLPLSSRSSRFATQDTDVKWKNKARK